MPQAELYTELEQQVFASVTWPECVCPKCVDEWAIVHVDETLNRLGERASFATLKEILGSCPAYFVSAAVPAVFKHALFSAAILHITARDSSVALSFH